MGKTSSAVKNRYNKKAYDQVLFRVPKGLRDPYKALCASEGTTANAEFTKYVLNRVAQSRGIEPSALLSQLKAERDNLPERLDVAQ